MHEQGLTDVQLCEIMASGSGWAPEDSFILEQLEDVRHIREAIRLEGREYSMLDAYRVWLAMSLDWGAGWLAVNVDNLYNPRPECKPIIKTALEHWDSLPKSERDNLLD